MKTSVDHLFRLYNNPFLLSPLLVTFYENYTGPRKRNILLVYAIFPLVLNEESLEKLSASNAKSSLRTFRQRSNLAGIGERVIEFKSLTNLSLQYLIDSDIVSIEKDLSVSIRDTKITRNPALEKYTKATKNLARMFNKGHIVSIYKQLGIHNL